MKYQKSRSLRTLKKRSSLTKNKIIHKRNPLLVVLPSLLTTNITSPPPTTQARTSRVLWVNALPDTTASAQSTKRLLDPRKSRKLADQRIKLLMKSNRKKSNSLHSSLNSKMRSRRLSTKDKLSFLVRIERCTGLLTLLALRLLLLLLRMGTFHPNFIPQGFIIMSIMKNQRQMFSKRLRSSLLNSKGNVFQINSVFAKARTLLNSNARTTTSFSLLSIPLNRLKSLRTHIGLKLLLPPLIKAPVGAISARNSLKIVLR
jgi:hypothetical protein